MSILSIELRCIRSITFLLFIFIFFLTYIYIFFSNFSNTGNIVPDSTTRHESMYRYRGRRVDEKQHKFDSLNTRRYMNGKKYEFKDEGVIQKKDRKEEKKRS